MGRRYQIKSKPNSYVERDRNGKFKNWVAKGKSLSQDRKVNAKNVVKAGYGHQGDQKRRIRNPFKPTTKTHDVYPFPDGTQLVVPKGVGSSSMPTLNLKKMKKILGR